MSVWIILNIKINVFQTIRDLHANSVNVKMITGDSKNIALSIGQNLNIHRSCDTALSGKTSQINP